VLLLDAFVALLREFGWEIAALVTLGAIALTAIRVLAVRLEKAYQEQIVNLKEGHASQVKELKEGHLREIAEVRAYGERGWEAAEEFRKQSERAVERNHDGAIILRDLANDIYEERTKGRGRALGPGR
jgi:hypothetical protein